ATKIPGSRGDLTENCALSEGHRGAGMLLRTCYDRRMTAILTLMSPEIFALTLLVTILAGVIKGMVGFAMPMIMISLMGGFVAPDVALAGLILPTLATNGMQALRQGTGEAWASVR